MSQDKSHLTGLGPMQKKFVIDNALLLQAEWAINFCIELLNEGHADHALTELKIMSDKIKDESPPWANSYDNPWQLAVTLKEKESA